MQKVLEKDKLQSLKEKQMQLVVTLKKEQVE